MTLPHAVSPSKQEIMCRIQGTPRWGCEKHIFDMIIFDYDVTNVLGETKPRTDSRFSHLTLHFIR